MQHTESSIKIYHTRDYSMFGWINGNRQLNEQKVKRIMRDIADGLDILRFCPILVRENNGKLEIIDGQHRYFVATKLKSQVWYVLAEDLDLEAIAKINSNTERWKNADYINAYVQLGNSHYIALQEFLDKYSLPFATSVRLLANGTLKGSDSNHVLESSMLDFKAGRYRANKVKEAETFVSALRLFEDFPEWRSGKFIAAISIILAAKKADIVELSEKYKRRPERLVKCDSAKAYLALLEEIHNMHERTRKVLY